VKIKSPKIRTKQMALAVVSVIVLIVLTSMSLSGLRDVENSVSEIRVDHEIVRTAVSVRTASREMESALRKYIQQPDDRHLDLFRKADSTAQDGLKRLKALVAGHAEQEVQVRSAEALLANWEKKVAEAAISSRRKSGADKSTADDKTLQNESTMFLPISDLNTYMLKLAESRVAVSDDHLLQAENRLKSHRVPIYIGIGLFSAALLITSFLMANRISKPIASAAALAEAIGRGELAGRIEVTGSDEAARLASSLNEMADSLTNHGRGILEGVEVLTGSVAQIAGAAAQLITSASETATAISQTTATVNEMEKTAKVVNETARNVADHSRHSDEIADSGTKATADTVQKMSLIKNKMEIVRSAVVKLNDNTKFVEEIVAAVQDVADQSNLLAVNASIEAARSGEHGKGFAVVAHEIKSLAGQSKEATDKVTKILHEIRKSVGSVVAATEEGGKAVQSGVEQSEAAGESIQQLADSIGEFSRAAGLIFSSTEKQFARVERVAAAMRDVEQATNRSVEGTTQLQDEARKLEQLALSLKSMARHYRVA
jgi:methyl-accepting chemotaxis protein